MIKMIVVCDFCGSVIPEDKDDNVKLHYTKEIDTKKIYPHLCGNCATKIDEIVRYAREGAFKKAELLAKYRKVNSERKKKLGMED